MEWFSIESDLKMSGGICGCHNYRQGEYSWHLLSRGQECCLFHFLQCIGQSPATRNFLAPNVNGANIEKF